MKLARIKTIGWESMLMALVVFAPTISADDAGKRHQRRERKHNENNHSGYRNLKPVSNSTYADQCGACHFTYQPELLPVASWEIILDGTDVHFGETVDLDEGASLEISGYLASNAADKSSATLAGKIMNCLGGSVPARITDIPYIRKEHHEITLEVFQRKSVGSLSNCSACHRLRQRANMMMPYPFLNNSTAMVFSFKQIELVLKEQDSPGSSRAL